MSLNSINKSGVAKMSIGDRFSIIQSGSQQRPISNIRDNSQLSVELKNSPLPTSSSQNRIRGGGVQLHKRSLTCNKNEINLNGPGKSRSKRTNIQNNMKTFSSGVHIRQRIGRNGKKFNGIEIAGAFIGQVDDQNRSNRTFRSEQLKSSIHSRLGVKQLPVNANLRLKQKKIGNHGRCRSHVKNQGGISKKNQQGNNSGRKPRARKHRVDNNLNKEDLDKELDQYMSEIYDNFDIEI